METPSSPQQNSSLDPTATPFTMSSQTPTPSTAVPQPSNPTSLPNGQPKTSKGAKKTDSKPLAAAENKDEAGAGAKLTGAQLKAQKKAEKAAKRAQEVAQRGTQQPQTLHSNTEFQRPPAPKKEEGTTPNHKRANSTSISTKTLPVRTAEPEKKTLPEKKVAILSHLYPSTKKPTISTANKEVHPAVLSLGLQLRDFVICGSSARTIAMLMVFKRVISDYVTPSGLALARHLTTHLSHQITYLAACRSLCVGQGNSIRWLKKLISGVDIELRDKEAKEFLSDQLDAFIRAKFTLADDIICTSAREQIKNGDTILVYGKSSVVEKALSVAWKAGKKFRVVVVDSRPLCEGKNMTKFLAIIGIPVQYCLLNGLADVVGDCTKCFLGASSMTGNGRLTARAGSAMVAMMAKSTGLPVIVLCETIKFSGRVALDSIVQNELGDADSLVEVEEPDMLTTTVEPVSEPKKGGKKSKEEEEPEEPKKIGLQGWRDQPNLHLLNLMYDVTPAEYLDMVVTELGNLPPSAVPVVNGIYGGEE